MRLAIITDDFNGEKGIIFEYDFETIKARIIQELGEEAGEVLQKLADELKKKILTI